MARSSEAWLLQIEKPLPPLPLEEEPERLSVYLDEIRYSYRKKGRRFAFPPEIPARDILEVLKHFYDGIAVVEVAHEAPIR